MILYKKGEGVMTRRERIRRVGILCCHFLRNLAFYEAGWSDGKFIPKQPSQFWINVNGNFIDICVLEWCKLFADEKKGKHYWRKVITDPTSFFDRLMKLLNISKEEFEAYIQKMRSYRDKFIAHLDSENTMNIPELLVAQQSAEYLYDYLLANEDEGNLFHDAPASAWSFYKSFLKEGELVYQEDKNLQYDQKIISR
jgi:hypothetical protein